MFKIIKKETIAPAIQRYEVSAPEIAVKAKPGQFVIVRADEKGERIPFTIADFDPVNGTLTLIFQEVGRSTIDLGKLQQGECILDLVGPLGKASEIDKVGTVVCVGGGVGVAPVYPITRGFKEAGNKVISIIGARDKEHLILKNEMESVSDVLYMVSDDGSTGRKGFVTDVLRDVLEKEHVNMVMAVGPLPMMEAVSELTRLFEIKTMVSLNPIMVDGTGMCGACRVSVGNETRFACVDGPEFDGHMVNWASAKLRAKMFAKEEKTALNNSGCAGGECQCHKQK